LREALFLVTDDTVLDIIEAVLAGNYYTGDYIDHVEYSVDFSRDKPCPTCGGCGRWPGTWGMECPTCHGEGDVPTMIPPSRVIEYVDCPDCGGDHFIPGKGRGM